MSHPQTTPHIREGVAGGTLLSLFAIADIGQLLHTALLAAIGAAVSCCVSYLMRWLLRKAAPGHRAPDTEQAPAPSGHPKEDTP